MSLRDPSTRELDSSTRANGRIHGDDIDEPLSSVPAPALATAPAAPPPPLDPKVDFIAGTIAGIASLLVGQPFDTIKVRLQTQQQGSGMAKPNYRNAAHAAVCIVRQEKIRGLYKGVMSPMLGVAAMNASVFGCYKVAMNALLDGSGADPDATPSLWQVCIAGSASGVVTSVLTTPIERLKILQQAVQDPPSARQLSLRSLLSTHSLRSLYRGITPTILRDLAYGPYFVTYEAVCRADLPWDRPSRRQGGDSDRDRDFERPQAVTKKKSYARDLVQEAEREVHEVEDGTISRSRILLAGGLAGIVGWGSTFALDVVKTRMQSTSIVSPTASTSYPVQHSLTRARHSTVAAAAPVTPFQQQPVVMSSSHPERQRQPQQQYRQSHSSSSTASVQHPYTTTWSTIKHSYQTEGARVFVRGLGPTLARSVPVNCVTFAVFEWTKNVVTAAGIV